MALALSAAVPPAAAATGADSDSKPPGWVVDGARLEPLGTEPLSVSGMGDYRGTIEVARQGGGVAVVNEVGLEDYVRGIQEMPPTWPAAALEAQAIAARTYALSSAASATATPWRAAGADICATDSCQVYRGLAAERQPGGASWVAAVAATEGQVLLSGERPILAMYSSSNGGRTKAGAAWYLRATADPDDATSPLSHWHYTLPLAALAPVLNVRPPVTLVGLRRVGGSVVLTVTSPGQPPSDHAIGSGDFMSALNRGVPAPAGLPAPLPTADFAVGTDGASAVVDGHGWGHGIGMSQYGAYGKARRGWQAADILAAYYGGIRPSVVPTGEPETIRVALQVGGGSARVTSAGPFRVVDRDGVVVVPEASGEWRFTPASGGVRVAPPAGWDQTQLDAVPTLAPAGMARRSPARVLVAAPAFPARRALVLLALALTAWAGGMTLRVHRGRRIPLL